MMTIEQKVKIFKEKFDPKFASYIEGKIKRARSFSEAPRASLKELKTSLEGGKRIRPFLVMVGARVGKNKVSSADVIKTGMAIELAHTSLLVHDDVIDNSVTRRGVAAYHVRAEKIAKGQGKEIAIAVGDYALMLFHELVNDVGVSEKQKQATIKYLVDIFLLVGLGQVLDITLADRKQVTKKNILELYQNKTACYTITAPLVAGAMLSGTSKSSIGTLVEYGDNLGVAFQIQDDVLDIFGKKDKTGKSMGQDIEEGKHTLLYHEAIKRASKKDLALLERVYGKKVSSQSLKMVREIFVRSGALDATLAYAQSLEIKALKALHKGSLPESVTRDLRLLGEYIIARES